MKAKTTASKATGRTPKAKLKRQPRAVATRAQPKQTKPRLQQPRGSGMRIGRVTAAARVGGAIERDFKFVLLCGLEGGDLIADGEWMGYVRSPWAIYPFVLKKEGRADVIYEGNEDVRNPTNLGQRPMARGALFTFLPPEDDPQVQEIVFEVVSCHVYE